MLNLDTSSLLHYIRSNTINSFRMFRLYQDLLKHELFIYINKPKNIQYFDFLGNALRHYLPSSRTMVYDALKNSQYEFAYWLIRNNDLNLNNIFWDSVRKGDLNIIKWVYPYITCEIELPIWFKYEPVIKWLIQHGAKLTSEHIDAAAHENMLDVVILLHEYGCACSPFGINHAHSNVSIIKWMHNNCNCKYENDVLDIMGRSIIYNSDNILHTVIAYGNLNAVYDMDLNVRKFCMKDQIQDNMDIIIYLNRRM